MEIERPSETSPDCPLHGWSPAAIAARAQLPPMFGVAIGESHADAIARIKATLAAE